MKKTLTLLASLFLLAILKPIIAQTWIETGPPGANIVSVKSTTSSLVAVSRSNAGPAGLWLSNDEGLTWANITGNLDNKKTWNMWTAGDTIFLSKEASYINGNSADDGGLYFSTNDGVNWTKLFGATFAPPDAYLKIGSTLFFGGSYGINRSTNQGQTWTFLNVKKDVLCFESIGTNIFFGTNSGVFKSTNNCTSWTEISTGIPVVPDNNYKRITGICKIGTTLYISNYVQGVFKSTNLGASWVAVNNGITDLNLLSIHANGNTLFAGSYFGKIFKSTDEGASWSEANQGFTNQEVNCFFQYGSKLYAGGSAGIFETSDNGGQWTDANENLAGHIIGTGSKTVESVIIEGGGYLFAGTYMGRIYRSADNGITWQAVGASIRSSSQPFFWTMIANNTNVFVSTYDKKLYTSADWGETWNEVVKPHHETESPMSMEVIGNRLYASFSNGTIMYFTDNNGLTWELIEYPPDTFYQLKGKKGNDIYYSGYYDNKVYKMAYGTTSFTYMGQVGSSNLYIEDIGTLGNALFASVADKDYGNSAGIYKSINDGVTWTYEGLTGTIIRGFTTDGNTIFARNEFNIFVRENNSGSWININSDLPLDNQCFYSTGMFANAGTLFAGISSRSLFRADIAQFTAPSQPSAIAGSVAPCIGSSQIYSVNNFPGTTYTWQFPSNWLITSGGTSSSVTVTVGNIPGIILVLPSNLYGTGPAQFIIVNPNTNPPAQPTIISGSTTPSEGSSQTYSVINDPGVTYTWSFPSGWVQTGGGTANSVTVTVGSGTGNIQVTPSTPCGTGTARTLAVTPVAGSKTINLTSVLLEGLYNGAGTMLQANDEYGAHWPAGVADHITVELHNAANYATIVYSTNVALSTTGTASVTIPADKSGSYYITIKHRNSIETTTAIAKSFAGSTIAQSFGTTADVFGGNLVQMADLGYAIFCGDVNQDYIIDSGDMIPVENDAASASSGYLFDDCNGDGLIDSSDMVIIENNAALAIGAATP